MNVALVMLIALMEGKDCACSMNLTNNGALDPAALNSRIHREHPKLELIFTRDLAVRLPREG